MMSAALLAEVTGGPVRDLVINADRYSLNSVNGFATLADGREVFFKFHQEDGEEAGVGEYYNARVLAEAGYPVTRPLFVETAPGRQMLVYPRVAHPRLSDVCSAIEKGESRHVPATVIAAQEQTDRAFAAIALRSLDICDDPGAHRQPLFQLFHNRLMDAPTGATTTEPGGRLRDFYRGRRVTWPGLDADFDQIWNLPWEIDGLFYPLSLADGFRLALDRLAPSRLLPGPVITAHGDAHNANVWYHPGDAGAPLSLFDPAFAGRTVPALLAEVKATFHNIFAHPFWLYEPDIAARHFTAEAHIGNGRIVVRTAYHLSPLREAFLAAKAELFWAPLLAELHARGWLAEDWEATIRAALFTCPTLVMNLLPGPDSTHNPTSSLLGFAQALRVLCPPEGGEADMVSEFFTRIRKANGWN